MAEIDKGLPNTRNKEEIPSDEELQEVAVQEPVATRKRTDRGNTRRRWWCNIRLRTGCNKRTGNRKSF